MQYCLCENCPPSVNTSSHDYVGSSPTAPNLSIKNALYFGLGIHCSINRFSAKFMHLSKLQNSSFFGAFSVGTGPYFGLRKTSGKATIFRPIF